jgi:hypothetical protein
MKQLMVSIIALLVSAAAMAKGEYKADREKFLQGCGQRWRLP